MFRSFVCLNCRLSLFFITMHTNVIGLLLLAHHLARKCIFQVQGIVYMNYERSILMRPHKVYIILKAHLLMCNYAGIDGSMSAVCLMYRNKTKLSKNVTTVNNFTCVTLKKRHRLSLHIEFGWSGKVDDLINFAKNNESIVSSDFVQRGAEDCSFLHFATTDHIPVLSATC
jgi:hypothetical protein